jgi:hypothetical protein
MPRDAFIGLVTAVQRGGGQYKNAFDWPNRCAADQES